jgi:DNA-binding transcriptional ArsR family regulator
MVQCSSPLDRSFAALADPTRRSILLRLGCAEASISELADGFEMTLTGLKKHVRVLEEAGLVTTRKIGRVRRCRLGPRRLEDDVDRLVPDEPGATS